MPIRFGADATTYLDSDFRRNDAVIHRTHRGTLRNPPPFGKRGNTRGLSSSEHGIE